MLTESNDSCQQHLADVTWIYSVASRNLISVASTELVYIPIAISIFSPGMENLKASLSNNLE